MSNKKLLDYLNLQEEATTAALETERISISGANDNAIQHSSMFYQPFSEEVCKKTCAIFEEYLVSTVDSTRRNSLIRLERMLETSDDTQALTLECLLYSSRVANSRITNDSVMFDDLADLVRKCYEVNPEVSFEALKHIFKVWNWDCQIGLALVGAVSAERNPVKREQLLSDMDKYIASKGDKLHKLLLYKVKAMVTRGPEYALRLFDVVQNLNNLISLDAQISGVIKHEAPEVFRGNESLFDRAQGKNALARSSIKDIKQILGFNEIDDIQNKIRVGDRDEKVRAEVARLMGRRGVNVERFCGIIRKNHLNNYLDVFEELLQSGSLDIHNRCCIALTYAQMVKGHLARFNTFLTSYDFPKDFCHLLRYIYNSARNSVDYENLDLACDCYFDEGCSPLLKKGITHTTKYDIEVSKAVLESFSLRLEENEERTDPNVLEKMDALLKDQKSKICDQISKRSRFIIKFDAILRDDGKDLDRFPEFFNLLISIINHCPRSAVVGFYFNIFNKTNNPERKERVKKMMGGIDVPD